MKKNIQITVEALFCDRCGADLHSYDGDPYVTDKNKEYCLDCALKIGLIEKTEWCLNHGICLCEKDLNDIEVL